jgi:hypothetical protein
VTPVRTIAPSLTDSAAYEQPFVSIPLSKVIIMSIGTFSFYHLVWFYRQWKRQQSAEHCSPFWRAVFGTLFFPVLALRVKRRRVDRGLSAGFSVVAVGLLYFLFQLSWRLPGSWMLVGLFSFLPLLPVQYGINEMNRSLNPGEPVDRFQVPAVIALILGGVVALLVLVGLMIPAPPS